MPEGASPSADQPRREASQEEAMMLSAHLSAVWRKSSYSNDETNYAQCVELADLSALGVGIRDSKAPAQGAMVIGRAHLRTLLGSVKSGRYDR
jgi:Domain of unknown function (DUF397)